VKVAIDHNLSIEVAGGIYFELGAELRLGWLRRSGMLIKVDDYWERLAVKGVINELYIMQRKITAKVVETSCNDNICGDSITKWYEKNKVKLERYNNFINDLKTHENPNLAMLTVAVRNAEKVCSD
jgi:glutamate dehydrogenase